MSKKKTKNSRKRPRPASPTDDEELECSPSPPLDRGSTASPTPSEEPDDTETISAFDKKWKTAIRSKEEVLEAQRETWSSEYYKHFIEPPTIIEEKGEIKYKFICKKHPTTFVTRRRTDSSTGNLKRHCEHCEPAKESGEKSIKSFAQGSTYDKSRLRYLIAIWIARRHRPFTIVEDPELHEIFQMLFAKVEVPSRTTVSRDVREIFAITRKRVGQMLQEYPGRLHLGLDGWTSPNVYSFLGVTVHRVVNGKVQTLILDFIKLNKSHTGRYLADQLKAALRELGIHEKILGLICDNASNNDTMVLELEALGGINSAETRVRCFAHILNLVVKAILSCFVQKVGQTGDSNEEAVGEDDDVDSDNSEELEEVDREEGLSSTSTSTVGDERDEYELDPTREAADRQEIEEVIREVETTLVVDEEEKKNGRRAVMKLKKLAKRVFHSPALREDLKICCERSKVPFKLPIRAIDTRWNSLTMAIQRALELRTPLEKLFALPQWDKAGKAGLRSLKLSHSEWALLIELDSVLADFLYTTTRISQSNTPLLHEVIPLIDSLTGALEDVVDSTTTSDIVRLAAARGRRILNKYYSKTDDSIMYRLAMLLHPSYKAKYFLDMQWEREWVENAVELLRKQWVTHYKPAAVTTSGTAEQSSQVSSASSPAPSATLDARRPTNSRFDRLQQYGRSAASTDALEEHLSTACLNDIEDPLQHWNLVLTTSKSAEKRALARMATDFLSAPAASTDVERAFSRGGLTVSKRRHSLNDESTRAATVLSSWAMVGGVIPERDVVEVFRQKNQRAKSAKGKDKAAGDVTTVINVEDD